MAVTPKSRGAEPAKELTLAARPGATAHSLRATINRVDWWVTDGDERLTLPKATAYSSRSAWINALAYLRARGEVAPRDPA